VGPHRLLFRTKRAETSLSSSAPCGFERPHSIESDPVVPSDPKAPLEGIITRSSKRGPGTERRPSKMPGMQDPTRSPWTSGPVANVSAPPAVRGSI